MARPDLSYLKNLTLALFGIPCGVLTGLTGLSPAPIVQPSLRWLIGLSGPPLNGVVLVLVSFAAWTGLLTFGQTGHVQWLNGFLVTVGTFAGAAFAGAAIKRLPVLFAKARPLWTFIPLALALLMIAQAAGLVNPKLTVGPLLSSQGHFLPLLWSLLIGVAVGFIGAAGDIGSMLTVPLLIYLLGQSIWEAEGTALYVLVLASLPSALIHALGRTLNTKSALFLSGGGILGALYGSRFAVDTSYAIRPETLMFFCGSVLAIYSLMSLFQKPITAPPVEPNTVTKRS